MGRGDAAGAVVYVRNGAGPTASFCRSLIAAMVMVALSFATAPAQERGPLEPLDTSSPRATLQSFLEEARALERVYVDYRAGKSVEKANKIMAQFTLLRSFFDLGQVPPAIRLKIGGASATELIDIFARLPELDLASIPGGPEFTSETGPDYWTIPDTEIALARVVEGPRKGSYLFAADTVDRLPEFHAKVVGLPPVRPSRVLNWRDEQVHFTGPWIPDRFVKGIPESLLPTLLGTPRWKVLVALAGLALVICINVVWGGLTRRPKASVSTALKLTLKLTMPALLVASYGFFHIVINLELNIQGRFAEGEFLLNSLVMYFSTAWAIFILVHLIVELMIASPWIPEASYDAHLLRLVGRVCALLGSGAIVVYGASDVGIPAIGLVAGLSVGGFALALAAKPTVENLIGGINLFADRPFRIGNYIIFGDSSGVVESIGARSCRIRGLDGTMMTVPNADLAAMHITNFSNRNKCFFQHVIGLRFETSRGQFEWLFSELWRRIAAHPLVDEDEGFPRVRLIGFGASSIDIDIRAYVLTTNYGEFLQVQEQLMLEIMKVVEEAGTGFAFPSQTTYLARDGGLDADRAREVEMQPRRQRSARESVEADAEEGPEADEGAER